MAIEINKIKELYDGTFILISDEDTDDILYKILDKSVKYVWGIDHTENRVSWGNALYPIYGHNIPNLLARNVNMEYLMRTEDFCKILPKLKYADLHIIQTNIIPPYYLDVNRIKGKTLYKLLKRDIDYLFSLEVLIQEYTSIISPHKELLERILNK